MNKELIEALEEIQELFIHEDYFNAEIKVDELLEALQKAKEKPTKNVEEFYKEWTSICRVYPKEITFCHTQEEMIQFAEEYSNQSKWISVEDRLPEIGQIVIVCYSCEKEVLSRLFQNKKDFTLRNITHWQPLPQPPVTNDKQ